VLAGVLYSKRRVQEGASPVIDVEVNNATTRLSLPEAPADPEGE
jgi:hypothetical protein